MLDPLDAQSNVITLTPENTGDFGLRPALPSADDIHRLTLEQQRDFLDFMANPRLAYLKPNMRLYRYIEKFTTDFAYEGYTGDASSTLATSSGNCMSLAVLTTALARVAGLDIDHELMDDVPVYEFNGDSVRKGLHVRTIIYDPDITEPNNVFMFTRPGIKIDYFPTRRQRFVSNLDFNDYLAMYYQNLASEAFTANDFDRAYWLAMEALQVVADYSPSINLLAVINRHAGNSQVAETIYRYGIERADDKLSLMKNYRILLDSLGREEEALMIQRRLDAMNDPSPFHWFQLARTSQDNGDYQEAIRLYNKALDLAPYLHEAWLGIAQANYELGRHEKTRRALEAAHEEAEKVSTRNLYQAKLVSLSQQIAD